LIHFPLFKTRFK